MSAPDLASAEAPDEQEGEETPAPRADRRDRRIVPLEQENASPRAEAQALRERLQRVEAIEEIIVQTGRRAAP